MSTATRGSLVVFGSGPGIGQHIASLFASRGFRHVILLSRNASRLKQDADAVRAAAPGTTVDLVATDISDTFALKESFKTIEEKVAHCGWSIEAVLFNAARVAGSKVLETSVKEIESDFKIAVYSLYTISQWIIPNFLELAKTTGNANKPSLLVTGGFLHREPYPPLFSLSACKAAQYNLVQTLYKTHVKRGVHCAMILVGGFVSPEAREANPKNIAHMAWDLFNQEPANWTQEIEIVEPDYEQRTQWV